MDTTQGALAGGLFVGTLTLIGATFVGCSPSDRALERAVEGKPGVVRVSAQEAQGDDFIPFADPPSYVDVTMESDARASEVADVLAEYEDEIADDDVATVEVRLRGPKQATLVVGYDVVGTEEMAEDLVAAQDSADVLAYRQTATSGIREVEVELVPLELAEVVAHADGYEAEGAGTVTLTSGSWVLVRATSERSRTLAAERQRFVLAADQRYGLDGATITGRARLVLWVRPGDADAVRSFADTWGPDLGRIVVHEIDGPRLP
ncbi:hypothetical protein [Nocardioides stalactiti]|uniref:hypothetical protein n=1 Tax=Nocardioides stalactiti TaxID=2755356 RepID=UPI0016042197|nr:hypothetical protein [Nocardioides stalactiti]